MKTRIILFVALLGACGDPTSPTVTVRDVAQGICNLTFSCCDRGEVDVQLGPFFDADNCAERLVNQATLSDGEGYIILDRLVGTAPLPNLAVLQKAVNDGRVRVNGTVAAECLDLIEETGCNVEEELPEPEEIKCEPPEPAEPYACSWRRIFEGQVGEGGACSNPARSVECKDDLNCVAVDSLGVEGVCTRPGDVDDYCLGNDECKPDLYCSFLDGTCQEPRLAGETCQVGEDGTTVLLACGPYLACDTVTETCVEACNVGAPCAVDGQCDEEAGLRCIGSRCDLPRAEGLPCNEPDDCAGDQRCAPAALVDGTVCQALLPLDAACDFRDADCESGFCDYTLGATGECAPRVDAGLCPSSRDEQCNNGFCETGYIACGADDGCPGSGTCNLNAGRCEYYCIALKIDGADCINDDECLSDRCINLVCRSIPIADGGECENALDCDSEYCNVYESPPVCATTPLINGSACVDPDVCESEVCFEGSCQAGLTEGGDCSSAADPPCGKDLYCNRDGQPNTCVPVKATGEPCDADGECSGSCRPNLSGQFVCNPDYDDLICDGLAAP